MFNFKSLGGGIQGISPVVTISTQQGNTNVAPLGQASQIPLDRNIIRNALPTTYVMDGKFALGNPWAQTPFRIAMNAGDLYSRQSESGGSEQIQSNISIGRLKNNIGSFIGGVRKGNGATGNQHYVYDSSDYVKFKRLMAKNKNYNDSSFGGANNGAYTYILASKRY